MELRISSAQRQQMLDWAAAAAPQEVCGLLFGHGGVVKALERTANVASNPCHEFEIDPSALIAREKRSRQGGASIIGYFHSHPNGVAKPSVQDATMAAADGRIWLIIAGSQLTAWEPVAALGKGHVSFVPVRMVEA